MSKYAEAQGLIKELYYEEDYCIVPELATALEMAIEALEVADRVSQIEYMEMPTPKFIETENGVKVNANILEAVEVITHNNLLAKIKGEEERIYAK